MKRDLMTTVAAAALAWAMVACDAAAQTAQPPSDIGTVSAGTGGNDLSAPPAPGTAADVAPSRGPLDASQPTSVVGPTYIRENANLTGGFDRIIQFSPSVQDVEPVGAGLQQNFAQTIRGFNYTEFNSLFDGLVLPGLPTNFAPQTGAYFLTHNIDSVTVDRGPGTASTLGYATFGGTVSTQSVSPLNEPTAELYGTYGTWDTKLAGVRLDTGILPDLGGARGLLDVSYIDADGSLSGTLTQRENIFTKWEVPVGDSTVVTLLGDYDYDRNHTPYGATLKQIQTFGPGYGLDDNPKSQNFQDYNFDTYNTDFEYVGVKSELGDGWGFDGKAYTNGYYQGGETGLAPNDFPAPGEPGTPNLTSSKKNVYFSDGRKITLDDNVPVFIKHNDFRDYGTIDRVTKDTAIGQIRFGLWFDYISASAYRIQAVGDLGLMPYYTNPKVPAGIYNRLYDTDLQTTQPYVEWALNPIEGLQITPGVKWTETVRTVDAPIISTSVFNKVGAVNEAKSYSAIQPAIDARYTFLTGLVGYAQAAKGFLAPPFNVLATTSPQNLTPQQTWNYQAGGTFQRDAYTLSADVYYIDFQNYLSSVNLGSGNVLYSNGGSAIFDGVEFEGTVRLGYGVSAYGNYSVNNSRYTNGKGPVALTPRNTAAMGLILHEPDVFQENDLVYGSIIGKFVGPQYLQDGPISAAPGALPTSALFPIQGYAYANLALGYQFPIPHGKTLDVQLQLNNISNDRSLIGLAGTAASNGNIPLYWVDPGRAVFVNVSLKI